MDDWEMEREEWWRRSLWEERVAAARHDRAPDLEQARGKFGFFFHFFPLYPKITGEQRMIPTRPEIRVDSVESGRFRAESVSSELNRVTRDSKSYRARRVISDSAEFSNRA